MNLVQTKNGLKPVPSDGRAISREHTPREGKEPRVIYLAFDKDILVGHVACHHSTPSQKTGGCQSELQSIFVLLEYHGRGIEEDLTHSQKL